MITKIKNLSNTNEKRVLLSNFFSLSVLQFFNSVLPLLTLPYLVRVLGAEMFGLVMFAQAFIMFFNIFVDFGFNLSATREVSIYRNDKNKLTEIFSSVIIIKAVLTCLSFVILAIIVFSFERFSRSWELYYLTFLLVIGQAMFPVWYFQGIERMKFITIVNVISRVVFTVLIFVVIKEKSDYIYVPIINGFGLIVGGGLSLWIIRKKFKQAVVIPSLETLKIYFKDSSQFFLSRVSVTIYTSANVFVLGIFTNNILVGYYSVAEKLYMALQGLFGPVAQVLYPYVAKEKNIVLFKKIFKIIVLLNVVGVVFLYFTGSYIFEFLFEKSFTNESLEVFHILLLATLVVVPSIMIGYPFLGALGFAKFANRSVIYSSVIHVFGIVLLALSDNITIFTVAYMVVLTQIVDLSYRLYGVKKNSLWNSFKLE